MIKILRAFVNWCERRWPERIILSAAEMEQVKALIERQGHIEARLQTLEVMTGFGVKAAKDGQQGAFIR